MCTHFKTGLLDYKIVIFMYFITFINLNCLNLPNEFVFIVKKKKIIFTHCCKDNFNSKIFSMNLFGYIQNIIVEEMIISLLFNKTGADQEHPQIAWGLIASIIVAISFFGVYAVQYTTFDLYLLLACGIFGYLLVKNDFPVAPLVLGPMIENNMRRALTISNGDFSIFISKPLSLIFLIVAVAWILIPLIMKMKGKNVVINEEE